MPLVLGIDTGGTFTDGVVVDTERKKVLAKTKAFTTKNDLALGIGRCINNIADHAKNVKLVCLSTTLATNAIVEGKGGKVGLLVTGRQPEEKLPECEVHFLKGKLDIKGKLEEELDERQVREALRSLSDQRMDALAISGFASVRNPCHELRIKEIARSESGIPVICAHELSSELGFHERTVTAVLNARLIPIIEELIRATRTALSKAGIDAGIMIVKGDGSLMNDVCAQSRPIETILSGPAASAVGGMILTGEKDALIVDIGGTTTDIANLCQGAVRVSGSGAKVGGWRTQIRAADIDTFGIGGDSGIRLDASGGIRVGPKKVKPLCVAGMEFAHLADEISSLRLDGGYELFAEQEIDCFAYLRGAEYLTGQDAQIAQILRGEAHSALYLSEKLGKDVESLNLTGLVRAGVLERISLTPTDVLHVLGHFREWDVKTADAAVERMAAKMAIGKMELAERIYDRVIMDLTLACLQSVADFERQSFEIGKDKVAGYFLEKAFHSGKEGLLKAEFSLQKPIIAVGAPAKAWLTPVCTNLNTRIISPDNAEVANAIGAAAGQIAETASALIRPDKHKQGYIAHLPDGSRDFEALEDAKEYALAGVREYAAALAKGAGAKSVEMIEHTEDIFVKGTSRSGVYVETRIRVTAVGEPLLKK